MKTLDVLPYDILSEILRWLDNESWRNVSLVNKSLRLAASPLIFRKMWIEKWYHRAGRDLIREMPEVILSNEAIASSIRVLDIRLRRVLSRLSQARIQTLPSLIAKLLTSLPVLTCLVLDLPVQYAESLFAELRVDAKKLTNLQNLTVPAWVWTPLARFCPHLRGLLVESQPPWTPEANITWFAQQCTNITVFTCFEYVSMETIKTLGQHFPQLEELGLLGGVEEKGFVDYLEHFRIFKRLRALWLPPARQLRMNPDLNRFLPSPSRILVTEERLMETIESVLIARGGPNVTWVTLGRAWRVAIYKRNVGESFRRHWADEIDGQYRGGMLELRHPSLGTPLT